MALAHLSGLKSLGLVISCLHKVGPTAWDPEENHWDPEETPWGRYLIRGAMHRSPHGGALQVDCVTTMCCRPSLHYIYSLGSM